MAAKLNRTADTLMKILDKEKVKKKFKHNSSFTIHPIDTPCQYALSTHPFTYPKYGIIYLTITITAASNTRGQKSAGKLFQITWRGFRGRRYEYNVI